MNVGAVDRVLRTAVGVALAIVYMGYAGFFVNYPYNLGVLIISLVLMTTGIAGYCPLYEAFGINTAGAVPREMKAPRKHRKRKRKK